LNLCPDLALDANPPTVAELEKRLSQCWIPDEVILYIGLASSLRSRIRGYYRTPLGARRPHSGGHFLKTLRNIYDLFVHYAPTDDPDDCEQKMLKAFCENTSTRSKSLLHDPAHPFPFANLEHPPGTRKLHGLTRTRAG
jgi:hypothetical protein